MSSLRWRETSQIHSRREERDFSICRVARRLDRDRCLHVGVQRAEIFVSAGIAEDDIFLSVLTIGELRKGMELIRRRDPKSASALDRWLRSTIDSFHDRILPVDQAVADEWGRMNVPDRLPVIDSLLAATAKIHGLRLVTRNTNDIARTGASFFNPFTGSGESA